MALDLEIADFVNSKKANTSVPSPIRESSQRVQRSHTEKS